MNCISVNTTPVVKEGRGMENASREGEINFSDVMTSVISTFNSVDLQDSDTLAFGFTNTESENAGSENLAPEDSDSEDSDLMECTTSLYGNVFAYMTASTAFYQVAPVKNETSEKPDVEAKIVQFPDLNQVAAGKTVDSGVRNEAITNAVFGFPHGTEAEPVTGDMAVTVNKSGPEAVSVGFDKTGNESESVAEASFKAADKAINRTRPFVATRIVAGKENEAGFQVRVDTPKINLNKTDIHNLEVSKDMKPEENIFPEPDLPIPTFKQKDMTHVKTNAIQTDFTSETEMLVPELNKNSPMPKMHELTQIDEKSSADVFNNAVDNDANFNKDGAEMNVRNRASTDVQSQIDHYLFKDEKSNDDNKRVNFNKYMHVSNESYQMDSAATTAIKGEISDADANKIETYAEPVMETIFQHVKSSVHTMKNGRHELEVELKPDFLGSLNIKLVSDKDGIIAKIKVSNHEVKDILCSQTVNIQDVLKNQGVEVKEIEFVSYETDAGLNNSSSESSRGSYKNDRRKEIFFNKYEEKSSKVMWEDVGSGTVKFGRVNYLV